MMFLSLVFMMCFKVEDLRKYTSSAYFGFAFALPVAFAIQTLTEKPGFNSGVQLLLVTAERNQWMMQHWRHYQLELSKGVRSNTYESWSLKKPNSKDFSGRVSLVFVMEHDVKIERSLSLWIF